MTNTVQSSSDERLKQYASYFEAAAKSGLEANVTPHQAADLARLLSSRSAAVDIATQDLEWVESKAFFAVANAPNGERIPVDSLKEQSRVNTAYRLGAEAATANLSAGDEAEYIEQALGIIKLLVDTTPAIGSTSHSRYAVEQAREFLASRPAPSL